MTIKHHYDVGLVACSSAKAPVACAARSMYLSQLFRLALDYALARCAAVYVVSARHELLELDQVIEPYDERLAGKRARDAWGGRVADRIHERHGLAASVLVLAGKDYADPIYRGWRGDRALVRRPLEGMMIGQRLSFLCRPAPIGIAEEDARLSKVERKAASALESEVPCG